LPGHCDPESGGCVRIGSDITACQRGGVKVLLSIGGAGQNYNLSSTVPQVAAYLWDTFLGGSEESRPFGNAVLNGIDIIPCVTETLIRVISK
jgi:chitinase